MNATVELITAWEKFKETHNQVSVDDFCRYYLVKYKTENNDKIFWGMAPPDLNVTLGKMIGRISSIMNTYTKMALKEPGFDVNWFYILNALYYKGEVKKTDIINYMFLEQSTGNDILRRLHKEGYITERADEYDKRARLVKLTKKAEKFLFGLYNEMYKPAYFLFKNLNEEDKKIIINLLSATEVEHSQIITDNKGKSLDELMTFYIGEEKMNGINNEAKKILEKFKKG